MFWTDRTSSAVCAPTVPGKTAASSRKARRNMQLYSFIPFELVIGKRVIGASAEKFRSEDQSIKLTETSNGRPSPSLTSPPITHKTGPLRQAVFKSYYDRFVRPDAFTAGMRAGPHPVLVAHALWTFPVRGPKWPTKHSPGLNGAKLDTGWNPMLLCAVARRDRSAEGRFRHDLGSSRDAQESNVA